jgi:signal transduction histidine kinase
MAILFCAILIKVYVAKIKKYNQLLFEKQLEQQKAVSRAVLETQEETLNNIALDLHDDAGQRLTYLNLQLEQLKLKQPEMNSTIAPISKTVNDLAINLRDLSHSVTSNSLVNSSLFSVFEKELLRINKLGVVTCHLEIIEKKAFSFTLEEKIIHYRIFQEVINNMLKHSRATTFTINVIQPDRPIFKYLDNGQGFNSSQEMNSNGLHNLQLRCELIDYNCDISSVINEGSTIQISKK